MYTFSLTALSAYSVGERERERASERDGRYKNRPKGVSQNERNDRASGGGIERERETVRDFSEEIKMLRKTWELKGIRQRQTDRMKDRDAAITRGQQDRDEKSLFIRWRRLAGSPSSFCPFNESV